MRNIFLFTYYQIHPCYGEDESYIKIRKIQNQKHRRLTKTNGNVNFTDLWLQMSDSIEKLEGKYTSQHISLLTDNNAFSDSVWHTEGKVMLVVMFKVTDNAECLENMVQRVLKTAEIIKSDVDSMQNVLSSEMFFTLDNADVILSVLTESFDDANIVSAKLFDARKEWFYSYNYIVGNVFKCNRGPSDDSHKGGSEFYECFLNKLFFSDSYLQHRPVGQSGSFKSILDDLSHKLKKCDNNKKWISYYQALYQVVNHLTQYEYGQRHEDLYYILYPSLDLFCKQLNAGFGLIEKTISELDSNPAKLTEYYTLQIKIEKSVSDFIDNMELLIHHIGTNNSFFFNETGTNILGFDIPVKLCLLYLAALHEVSVILKDENYQYRFLLAPLAYSRPTTRLFDFGLQPEDRLVQVRIARHQIYSPRSLLAILVHEGTHYIGQKSRLRDLRAEKYLQLSVQFVLEMLLPNQLFERFLKSINISDDVNQLMIKEWYNQKQNMEQHYCILIQKELINNNKYKEHKYLFSELIRDIEYFIRLYILYDSAQYKLKELNKLHRNFLDKLQFSSQETQNVLLEYFLNEFSILQKTILEVSLSEEISKWLEIVGEVMKEVYADYGSILILGLEPLEYLECYLVSEGHMLSEDTIKSTLVNRVAMVHMMMSQDNNWLNNWENATEAEWDNEYLWKLKIAVEDYLKAFNQGQQNNENEVESEKKFAGGHINPFFFKECVDLEIEYLEKAYCSMRSMISKGDVQNNVLKLRNLYRHFKVYGLNGGFDYEQLFYDMGELIRDYKTSIVNINTENI